MKAKKFVKRDTTRFKKTRAPMTEQEVELMLLLAAHEKYTRARVMAVLHDAKKLMNHPDSKRKSTWWPITFVLQARYREALAAYLQKYMRCHCQECLTHNRGPLIGELAPGEWEILNRD